MGNLLFSKTKEKKRDFRKPQASKTAQLKKYARN